MKTHDFDRRMRVLAGQEVFAMSKESENRLRQALHSPQIRPAARRLSRRPSGARRCSCASRKEKRCCR